MDGLFFFAQEREHEKQMREDERVCKSVISVLLFFRSLRKVENLYIIIIIDLLQCKIQGCR